MTVQALSPHDAAMAAKVDELDAALKGTPQPAPVVPPVEPPKDEAPATPPASETPPVEPPKEPAKPETPPEGETPETPPAEAAGKLDLSVLEQEFATAGALSEDSYKLLETAGIPKDRVDAYIAGQLALAAAHDAEGFALAGGKEQYQAMGEWARVNLPPAEVQAFDDAVTSGDSAKMKQAILALKSQYAEAAGSMPQLNNGIPAGTGGESAFASRAEVTAAMRDPRYGRDPAYRAMVERRIGLMDVF